MRHKSLALKLCLTLTATLLCLALIEIALRGYGIARKTPRAQPPKSVRLHIVTDSPILYGLNPRHPEISSQGLRNEEVSVPKPEGTFRILVLGDSVTYGWEVAAERTFPKRIEALLSNQPRSVEVINAGVLGYTAYNELQYYLTEGRRFEPDIVIVAFCMNDAVNPRLHWNFTKEAISRIPEEAIPNHDYDQNVVLPRMQKMKDAQKSDLKRERQSLLEYSELYKALAWRVRHLFPKNGTGIRDGEPEIPTHITGEDALSIEVLLDESSPERLWLTSIYDQLHSAVKADGAMLVVAFFPLAYQLDTDYPFFPQEDLLRNCKRKSILCVDLLPLFRRHPQNIFCPNDIWHLTEYGHELSAEGIVRFLQDNDLIDDTRGKRPSISGS